MGLRPTREKVSLIPRYAFLFGLLLSASSLRAEVVSENLDLFGYAKIWATGYEQMEETEGLYQHPSRDGAATWTTGFSINMARAGFKWRLLDEMFELGSLLRLEKNPGILDLYVGFRPLEGLELVVGQIKIPGPYENLLRPTELDFILRSRISEDTADFSLARTTYASSLFYGVHSYLRDLGLAVKWQQALGWGVLKTFLMVGNGLGANLYIGGETKREYILTNPGQLFSGARVELADLGQVLTIGAHFNYNWHDNMVFNSGRVVYDLHRLSWSSDARIQIPGTGLRLTGLYSTGKIEDDYDNDDRTDLAYRGFELKAVWNAGKMLARFMGSSFFARHEIELGLRFEREESEWNENGQTLCTDIWTLGVNYHYRNFLKLQLNAILRDTDDPSLPNLDDNALIACIQVSF